MANLETKYVGLTLKSPIVVASAGITETVERMQRAQDNGAAAVVMKSLFEEEISRTSPTPRFKVLRHDLEKEKTFTLMSYEQASEWGPERYGEEIARVKAKLDIKVIASINCYTDEGWVRYAKAMEEAGADALELNVSCPHGSITFTGEDVENTIYRTVRLVRESVKLPIIPKISPMLTAPLNVVKEVKDIGADGVTIFNRMTALEIDVEEERPTMPGGYAGHGGPWAIQYPLRWISAIYPQVDIDIAGSGGVSSWQDVVKYILAGATVVQICTAVVMNGYEVIGEFVRGLERYMEEKGYETIDEFRGRVCGRILATEQIPREHVLAAEIDRKLAPCTAACPIHVPAQSYVRLIAQGKFARAYEMIRAKDPFQSVCAYVCYHPCESECTRGDLDSPIAIRALKRFVLEWGKRNPSEVKSEVKKAPDTGFKVAILGSGPAGLTAAHDLAKAGHDVTVFEALPVAGGMLSAGIPEYRLPREVLKEEIEYIKSLGVKIKTNTSVGRGLTLDDLKKRGFNAVLIAIGAHRSLKLRVPGEDSEGISHGIDFLRELNLNGKAEVGKRVAVVGGGNTAMDVARSALRLGAEEVYLVYRRTKDEMPASDWEIREAEEEGVRVLYLVAPTEVLSENGKVVGLRCLNLFLGDSDEGGRRRPEVIQGTEFVLKTDMVILAVSQSPDLRVLSNAGGNLTVDPGSYMTNIGGVFAAGDAVSGKGSVIEAIASGRRAALEIDRYLRGDSSVLDVEPEVVAVDKRDVIRRNGNVDLKERVILPVLSPEERKGGFQGVELALTEEQAVEEAKRCLACGCGIGCDMCYKVCIYFAVEPKYDRYEIDRNKCDGCGICVERCPNNAIAMVGFKK